jgi:cell division initiation protein
MTQQQSHVQNQSPANIRSEVFSHRMRGLDEEEVRDYLELVASQVQATDAERTRLHTEIEHLRAENHRLREAPEQNPDDISPQAVMLFSQAQQVADQLVEEAVVHARDLMMSARCQQRDILKRAHEAAEEAVRRTGANRVHAAAAGQTAQVREVEYVRTFAKVAQVQLRSVLDALTEQVDRLDEVTRVDGDGEDSDTHALPVPHSRAQHEDLGIVSSDGASESAASIYEQMWSAQARTRE